MPLLVPIVSGLAAARVVYVIFKTGLEKVIDVIRQVNIQQSLFDSPPPFC